MKKLICRAQQAFVLLLLGLSVLWVVNAAGAAGVVPTALEGAPTDRLAAIIIGTAAAATSYCFFHFWLKWKRSWY